MSEVRAFPSGFSFSQSSLQDYSDCARRFQLKYIEHMSWPISATVTGETGQHPEIKQAEALLFHRLVHQHLLGMPSEKLASLATTPNLQRWWNNYITLPFPFTEWEKHPEVVLSMPIGAHQLIAKFDLIAVRSGQAVIIDWKTYHERPKNDTMATRMQTRVYQALLITSGGCVNSSASFSPEKTEMWYWYAEFPREPAIFQYSEKQHKQSLNDLTDLINEITHHRVFPMTAHLQKCKYCGYCTYCHRGITVINGSDDEEEDDQEIRFFRNIEQTGDILY